MYRAIARPISCEPTSVARTSASGSSRARTNVPISSRSRNVRRMTAAASYRTADRTTASSRRRVVGSSHNARNCRKISSPASAAFASRRVASIARGENGKSTAATKSSALAPKKWCTSAGSTPAFVAIALIVVPSYPLSAKHSRAASSTALRVSVLPGRRPAGDTMHPPRRVGSGRDANDRELRHERFAQVAVRDQLTLSFDENSRAIGAELSNVRLRSHLIEDDLLGNRTFPADLGGFDIELDERRRNGFPGSVELCSNRVLAGRPKSAAMLVEPTFGAFIGGVPPDRDRGPGSQYSYDLARCAIEVNPVPRLSEGHEVEGSVGERKLVGVGEHRRDAGRARPQTGQHVGTVIDGHDPGAAL